MFNSTPARWRINDVRMCAVIFKWGRDAVPPFPSVGVVPYLCLKKRDGEKGNDMCTLV